MSPRKVLWNVLAVVGAEQGKLCLCVSASSLLEWGGGVLSEFTVPDLGLPVPNPGKCAGMNSGNKGRSCRLCGFCRILGWISWF